MFIPVFVKTEYFRFIIPAIHTSSVLHPTIVYQYFQYCSLYRCISIIPLSISVFNLASSSHHFAASTTSHLVSYFARSLLYVFFFLQSFPVFYLPSVLHPSVPKSQANYILQISPLVYILLTLVVLLNVHLGFF